MGSGFLRVEVRILGGVLPVKNVVVVIKDDTGKVLHRLKTNDIGNTIDIKLDAPEKRRTFSPNYSGPYFSKYNVEVSMPEKFITEIINGVQIFDEVKSILPVEMIPKPEYAKDLAEIHNIPENNLYSKTPRVQIEEEIDGSIGEIAIPDYIVVHMGEADSNSKNIRVNFTNYIKNVASSEIYPTWPQASIEANIYAIISFTLNRVTTNCYRGKGYVFDITNLVTLDQSFIDGRNIFENISNTVDRIFNCYIRKEGVNKPYCAKYCNGISGANRDFSQWGTVTLANQGLTPLQILRYYYPKDIEIAASSNFRKTTPDTDLQKIIIELEKIKEFPNVVLELNSEDENVTDLQYMLNCISRFYSCIPPVVQNSIFDETTKTSVIECQKLFGLNPDGIANANTWTILYHMFKGIKKIIEGGFIKWD